MDIRSCVFFSITDFGSRHFVNLVTGPTSKNTNLQDLFYFLYLKTVKSKLQCIKGMHIFFSFSAIIVTLGCMGLEHELSKVVNDAPPRF